VEKLPEPEFLTRGEPCLEAMCAAADSMIRGMASGKPAYWVSFLGGCGNGKTMLARKVYRFQQRYLRAGEWRMTQDVGLTNAQTGIWCDWSNYASELADFKAGRRESLKGAWFLVLDDIGADSGRAIVTDELFRILNSRLGKWTIITSNLTPDGIAERLDQRIASRLIRDGNVLIQNTAPDWALRQQ
jgi:chromosomal replication initiation ATPase DnaA